MKIKQGDIVDIIAPSSSPQDNRWRKGLEILESWGLKPRLAKGAIRPWLFHASKNRERTRFLSQAFSQKDSSVVWMLRGGYGLQKLMPSFVQSYSKEVEKLFIGYSDSTPLHIYLNSQNQKTVHAPLISELPDLSEKELSLLKKALFGLKKEINFNNLKVFGKHPPKKIRACITGGNLSLLSSSVGAGWFPSFKSYFLFVEDVNEEDYKADRFLHHLFYSGSLKGVRAILFGGFDPIDNKSFKKILESFSDVCNIPMIFGLPCGHKQPNCPLPFQTTAELDIQGNKAVLKVKI